MKILSRIIDRLCMAIYLRGYHAWSSSPEQLSRRSQISEAMETRQSWRYLRRRIELKTFGCGRYSLLRRFHSRDDAHHFVGEGFSLLRSRIFRV